MTSGGPAAGEANPGANGRLVFGCNTAEAWTGVLLGSTKVEMADGAGHNLGMRKLNPLVCGSHTETPYLPHLVGGAEVFGMTALSSSDPAIASLLNDVPVGAKGALILMDDGPAGLGQDWDGFDLLLLVNLGDQALARPRLGAGEPAYLQDALTGGYARDPRFGGAGYVALGELPAHGIYATLVPEGIGDFSMGFGNMATPWASAATLAFNIPLYAVTPAADFDRDGDVDGDDLAVFRICGRGPNIPVPDTCRPADFDGDADVDQADFGIWQRCFSGAGVAANPHCAD
jgi:hypothetical protein